MSTIWKQRGGAWFAWLLKRLFFRCLIWWSLFTNKAENYDVLAMKVNNSLCIWQAINVAEWQRTWSILFWRISQIISNPRPWRRHFIGYSNRRFKKIGQYWCDESPCCSLCNECFWMNLLVITSAHVYRKNENHVQLLVSSNRNHKHKAMIDPCSFHSIPCQLAKRNMSSAISRSEPRSSVLAP